MLQHRRLPVTQYQTALSVSTSDMKFCTLYNRSTLDCQQLLGQCPPFHFDGGRHISQIAGRLFATRSCFPFHIVHDSTQVLHAGVCYMQRCTHRPNSVKRQYGHSLQTASSKCQFAMYHAEMVLQLQRNSRVPSTRIMLGPAENNLVAGYMQHLRM